MAWTGQRTRPAPLPTVRRSSVRLSAGLAAPEWALDENDSYTFFDALEDLIRTGPTGTNVGDIHVVLAG